MKKVLFVIGFSTTGKSSIGKNCHIIKEVSLIDTDLIVSEKYNKDNPHIYNIYCDLSDNITGSRINAIKFIENEEKEISKNLKNMVENNSMNKIIISCGPFIVTRDGFSSSLRWLRENHDVKVILLEKSPESVYDGLTERINHIRNNIGQHQNFGCWDEGVTMKYDSASKSWVPLDIITSIGNIKTIMDNVSVLYRKISDYSFQWNKKEEICKFVSDFFGIK